MSVEPEIERALIAKLTKIEDSYYACIGIIKELKARIIILEQENEDLKGQLRQFGIDLANKGEKKGLFLH